MWTGYQNKYRNRSEHLHLFQDFLNRYKGSNYDESHRHLHVPQLLQLFSKVLVFFEFFMFFFFLCSGMEKYTRWQDRSLSDNKSSQFSRTFLSILADLKNAVVWMVSLIPQFSNFSSLFSKPLAEPFQQHQAQLSSSPTCLTVCFWSSGKVQIFVFLFTFYYFLSMDHNIHIHHFHCSLKGLYPNSVEDWIEIYKIEKSGYPFFFFSFFHCQLNYIIYCSFSLDSSLA